MPLKRHDIISVMLIIICAFFSGCKGADTAVPPVIRDSFTAEVSSGVIISDNRVLVTTPDIDVNISRDSVPSADFEKTVISVPSINTVSPDFSVYIPKGASFDELFNNVENEGVSITLDEPATVSSDANLRISISGDTIKDMKTAQRPDTPLTLYYRMSSYNYQGKPLHGACTPMTAINCLNRFNDNGECTLSETLDLAYRLGIWTPEDGMSAEGIFITVAALNELHETANTCALFGPKDCDELGDIIDKGLTAGVCIDSSMLWRGTKDGYADHMIAVLGTKRDIYGTLEGFEIIDNGMGLKYISADLYDECALGNKLGFVMVFGNPENPPYQTENGN